MIDIAQVWRECSEVISTAQVQVRHSLLISTAQVQVRHSLLASYELGVQPRAQVFVSHCSRQRKVRVCAVSAGVLFAASWYVVSKHNELTTGI